MLTERRLDSQSWRRSENQVTQAKTVLFSQDVCENKNSTQPNRHDLPGFLRKIYEDLTFSVSEEAHVKMTFCLNWLNFSNRFSLNTSLDIALISRSEFVRRGPELGNQLLILGNFRRRCSFCIFLLSWSYLRHNCLYIGNNSLHTSFKFAISASRDIVLADVLVSYRPGCKGRGNASTGMRPATSKEHAHSYNR